MSVSEIRTENVTRCPLCGTEDRRVLYTGLRDRLFGAPGEWNLKGCGLSGTAYLDPRPLPEDIGKAYTTYYTHSAPAQPAGDSLVHRFYRRIRDGYLGRRWGYDNGLRTWQKTLAPLLYLHPGRRADLDFSVMYLETTPGGRLLDVGCGNGEFIERMKKLGWYVEGIDLDENAVRVARERGLEVRAGTLESQRYPSMSFDAVTMSHVIEHVHAPIALMRECYRLLKPGGRLVIVTPNASSMGHKYFKEAWRGLEPPRHLCIFTPSSLDRLVKGAGFKRCRISSTIRDANTMMITSRRIGQASGYLTGCRRPRLVEVWGRTMQFLEWAALKVDPDIGEEIASVSVKR